ncbi:TetR family transcriptional regulator [Nocardia terpenica]|uniref:TetR family transcriptional regulator n=2 Tax=Nocardia terpenica TaxID=455432 RepID=A0A164LSD0_9NOCA|nr:TetR family transcriptional regulator [Nocardia terpenica]
MDEQVPHMLRSDARDNRERILAVARNVFATEGLDVPMREIARRARVGAATLYRRFPTKEALVTAAFAEQMTACTAVVQEGLASADAWQGFRLVVEKILEMHALDRGFATAFTTEFPTQARTFGTDRDRTVRALLELIRRAKESGELRADFVVEDFLLAMMANHGIRTGTPAATLAASRRFTALIIQSFQAHPAVTALPPPVHLPLTPPR